MSSFSAKNRYNYNLSSLKAFVTNDPHELLLNPNVYRLNQLWQTTLTFQIKNCSSLELLKGKIKTSLK